MPGASVEVRNTPAEDPAYRPTPGSALAETKSSHRQWGEFVMIVRRYGDRDGWWITPETALIRTRREPKPPRSGGRAPSVPDGAVNHRDPLLPRSNRIRRRPALTLLGASLPEAS